MLHTYENQILLCLWQSWRNQLKDTLVVIGRDVDYIFREQTDHTANVQNSSVVDKQQEQNGTH